MRKKERKAANTTEEKIPTEGTKEWRKGERKQKGNVGGGKS